MASSKFLSSIALFLSFNILFAAVFVSCDKYTPDNNGNGNGNGNATPDDDNSSNGILGLLPGLVSVDIGGNSGGADNSNDSSGYSQNSNSPAYPPAGRKVGKYYGNQDKSGCGTLNLGVCLNLLNLVNLDVGDVPTEPCCSLIQGLVDLEVAACLCTDIKADVLGILNINLPVSLSVLLNNCGRKVPANYICNP